MGGPSKKRAQAEKKGSGSSDAPQSSGDSSGRDDTQRSTPKSIPRLDGNRDPAIRSTKPIAVDYSKPNDLKNISDFLGMAGWYVARGVSPISSSPIFVVLPGFLSLWVLYHAAIGSQTHQGPPPYRLHSFVPVSRLCFPVLPHAFPTSSYCS
jgi:hypothetical protein